LAVAAYPEQERKGGTFFMLFHPVAYRFARASNSTNEAASENILLSPSDVI
jgi:hypothetical protein